VTNGKSATPSSASEAARRFTFNKAHRLLKPAEFRKVYEEGFRIAGACFAAFCWQSPAGDGPRIGFTAPRALGKAVRRNRMKRRVRECLRRNIWRLPPYWWIVVNLRRAAADAPWSQIEQEVGKLIERCQR
jgi:ribonuclease P protein component